MSDGIIDLGEYARRKEAAEAEPAVFAIWGGEGERARFALPLWRAAGLLSGGRAALASRSGGDGPLEARVVLDLRADPARTELPPEGADRLHDAGAAPSLAWAESSVTVFLGGRRDRRWYLMVDEVPRDAQGTTGLEELYFLAGECSALLFHRDLDTEPDGE